MKLQELPNIGKTLAERLLEAGIQTPSDLHQTGSKDAFEKVRELDETACLNTLLALEGALKGVRWHDLPLTEREDLKLYYHSLEV